MSAIKLTVLRKLIWKEWLKSLMVAVLALFLLFSVAELITGFLRMTVTPLEVLTNYLLLLPLTFSKVVPLGCLLASLFSFQRLRSRNELVAIFASGFSRREFIFSVVQISSIIMALQFINLGYLDPWSKQLHREVIVDGEKKFSQAKSKGLLLSMIDSGKIWYRSENYYISYSAYDKNQKVLIQPTFFYFNKSRENTQIIKAQKAIRNNESSWTLLKAQKIKNISEDAFPEVKYHEQLQLSLQEDSSDFDRIDNDLNTLGLISLFEFVLQIKRSGILANEYEIFLLKKIADSIICLLFALVPIAIIFSPSRRSSSFGKNVLFAILFILGYWVVQNAFLAMGNSAKISPMAATLAAPSLCLLFFLGPCTISQRL